MKIGMIDIAISSAIEKKFTCSTGPCVTFPPLGKNYSLPGFKSSCIANCSRNIDIELNETNLLIDTSWIYITSFYPDEDTKIDPRWLLSPQVENI